MKRNWHQLIKRAQNLEKGLQLQRLSVTEINVQCFTTLMHFILFSVLDGLEHRARDIDEGCLTFAHVLYLYLAYLCMFVGSRQRERRSSEQAVEFVAVG